jgi:hypothetical protein
MKKMKDTKKWANSRLKLSRRGRKDPYIRLQPNNDLDPHPDFWFGLIYGLIIGGGLVSLFFTL